MPEMKTSVLMRMREEGYTTSVECNMFGETSLCFVCLFAFQLLTHMRGQKLNETFISDHLYK